MWGGVMHFPRIDAQTHRAVPVPLALLEAPDLVHGIRELQSRYGRDG